MSREDIKRIFFELLTEDEEFKQRLTEFILSAVAEKFDERVAQDVKPPKSEEVAQEKYSPEFIQKVAEHSGFDKLRGEKIAVENQCKELQAKCDKLADDKKFVESQRDELQAKCDKLADDKKFVESQRDDLQAKCDKLSNDKKFVESQRDDLQTKFDKLSNDKKFVESQRDDLQTKFDKLADDKIIVENQRDELQTKFDKLSDDKKVVESQLADLQDKFDKLAADKKIVENQRDELQDKFDKLADEKKVVEGQRDELQAKFDKLSNDKRIVEGQRDDLQTKFDKLLGDKRIVEGERDELNRQLEILLKEKESAEKQLAERFADGWDVYQTFLKLNAEVRENSGLYAKSFEAFICSGAQLKRLENIWESALDCKRGGKMSDAQIFWDVFAYCVRLVNAAQGDKIIEILDTQIGDRYDTDKHSTSGTNSSTQGVVREIILAGYRNNTSRKIVKKSNVRVG